jgi:hypothetical protein
MKTTSEYSDIQDTTAMKSGAKASPASVSKFQGLTGEPGGVVTATLQSQLGKMPWVSFLGLSAISMIGSVALVSRREEKDYASFVGLWAPCFMLLGVYNKLVAIDRKLERHAAHMPPPAGEVPSSTSYLS